VPARRTHSSSRLGSIAASRLSPSTTPLKSPADAGLSRASANDETGIVSGLNTRWIAKPLEPRADVVGVMPTRLAVVDGTVGPPRKARLPFPSSLYTRELAEAPVLAVEACDRRRLLGATANNWASGELLPCAAAWTTPSSRPSSALTPGGRRPLDKLVAYDTILLGSVQSDVLDRLIQPQHVMRRPRPIHPDPRSFRSLIRLHERIEPDRNAHEPRAPASRVGREAGINGRERNRLTQSDLACTMNVLGPHRRISAPQNLTYSQRHPTDTRRKTTHAHRRHQGPRQQPLPDPRQPLERTLKEKLGVRKCSV